jgi:hypothetical protein
LHNIQPLSWGNNYNNLTKRSFFRIPRTRILQSSSYNPTYTWTCLLYNFKICLYQITESLTRD